MDLTLASSEEPQTEKAKSFGPEPLAAPSVPGFPPKANEGPETTLETTEFPSTGTQREALKESVSTSQRESQASDSAARGNHG